MPGTLASLVIKLGLDATGVEQGVAKANRSIGGLATGAGTAMRVAGSLIGGGLALAAKGALEMEDRAARFQADTGASAEEARHFADVVNAAAGSSLVSMDDIAASATRIRTDLGLTGDAADESLTSFLRYERATKQGADAVLAYDDILDAWNLTAADTGPIMDTLIAGQQTYGGSIAESQDLLAQLAPVLQGANMSWQQGAELINLFNSAGVDATAGITGMTKALGKVESPEELQALLVDIASTVDPFERAQKAIDAFGAKAGPKLAQALQASGGDLSRFGFELDEVRGRTEEAAQALDDTLTSKVRLGVNQALALLRGFGMQVGPILTGAVSAISFGKSLGLDRVIAPLFRGLGSRAATAFSAAFSLGGQAIRRITDAIGGALSGIGAKLAANGALMSGMDKLGQLMGSRLGTAIKGVAILALAAIGVEQWGQLQAQIEANRNAAEGLNAETTDFLAGMPSRDEVQAKIDALKQIPEQLDPLKRALFETGGLFGTLGADPKAAWQTQIDSLQAYLDGPGAAAIADGVDSLNDAATSAIDDGAGQVADSLDQYVTAFADNSAVVAIDGQVLAIKDAASGLWDVGPNIENAAADTQGAVADWIATQNSALGDAAQQIGTSIDDIVGTIKTKMQAVQDAFDIGIDTKKRKNISGVERLKAMSKDIDAITRNLRASIAANDPVNTAYWESALIEAKQKYATATNSMSVDANQVASDLAAAGIDMNGTFLSIGADAAITTQAVNSASANVNTQPAAANVAAAADQINGSFATVNQAAQQLGPGIAAAAPAAQSAMNDVVSGIERIANGVDLQSSGAHMVGTWAQGMWSNRAAVQGVLNKLAHMPADYLGFSSPPPLGPLHDIRSWGPHMVAEWARPIGSQLGEVERTAGRLAAAMTPRPTMPTWAGANAHGPAARWAAVAAVGPAGRGDVVHVHVGTLIANDAGLDELERRMERRARLRRRDRRLVGSPN